MKENWSEKVFEALLCVLLAPLCAIWWIAGLGNVDGEKRPHGIFADLILPGLVAWLAMAAYFMDISKSPWLQYVAVLFGLRAIWPLGDFNPVLKNHFPSVGVRASKWIHGAFAVWNAPIILVGISILNGRDASM